MRYLTAIVALAFSTSLLAAADDECLKNSARTEPCPRLLYKARQVEDVNGSISKKVVCICLEDFEPLLVYQPCKHHSNGQKQRSCEQYQS